MLHPGPLVLSYCRYLYGSDVRLTLGHSVSGVLQTPIGILLHLAIPSRQAGIGT